MRWVATVLQAASTIPEPMGRFFAAVLALTMPLAMLTEVAKHTPPALACAFPPKPLKLIAEQLGLGKQRVRLRLEAFEVQNHARTCA